jgi:hypothetical protein
MPQFKELTTGVNALHDLRRHVHRILKDNASA